MTNVSFIIEDSDRDEVEELLSEAGIFFYTKES